MIWALSVNAQTDHDTIRTVRRMVRGIVKHEGGSGDEARDMELAVGEALSNAN